MASFLKTAVKTAKAKSGDRYKLPDDKRDHPIRIVPFDDTCWSFKVFQHWAPDTSGDGNFDKSYVCPEQQPKAYLLAEGQDELPTFGKECPFELRIAEITAELENLQGKGDEASKKRVKYLNSLEWSLRPQESYFLQIVDREDQAAGLKEFYAHSDLHAAILNAYTDYAVEATGVADREALMELDDDKIPDLFDVFQGHDILVRKTPKSTGRGHIYHASIVEKSTPLAINAAEIKLLQKQVKDPVAMVTAMINEQASDLDAALEAQEQRHKLKYQSAKPIKGAQVDDDKLFENRGSKPGQQSGGARQQTQTRQTRNTDDDLPHLDAVDSGGGDSPDFQETDDDDEAQFTQAHTPPARPGARRPGSRIADELASLDAK